MIILNLMTLNGIVKKMTFEDFIQEWKNEKDYIKVFTSGSTGKPKEILLKKDFVITSALRTINFFNININSRLHSCISPDFIGGKMMAVRSLIAEAAFTWEIPSNEPLKNISSDEVIDLLAVVPSQMLYVLEHQAQMPVISNIIIGGSSINPCLRKKIIESRYNAYETYGMTETASHIALRKIDTENSPFRLLPEISISVDSQSCLKIKFQTGEVFQTNDIVEIVSDSEFIIKGRKDNIIISGGRKINPLEIEEKISQLIANPFCITGFPDKKWTEKIILIIEGPQTDILDLKTYLRRILKPWENPKDIMFVSVLPRTRNGKIIRPKCLSDLSSFAHDNNLSSLKQNRPE